MHYENRSTAWRRAGLAVLLTLSFIPKVHAVDNLKFKGTLVEGACSIRPGDEDLTFDLREITTKYLYLNTRTLGERFELHLEDCDVSIGKSVTIKFDGTPNMNLPGALALDTDSVASGVGIGIETLDHKPLPLGQVSDEQLISDGDNIIALLAYLQGEPKAIQDKTIGEGAFKATSTFTLDYP